MREFKTTSTKTGKRFSGPDSPHAGQRPGSFAPSKTYSEEKAGQIDEEVARVVEEAHQRVQGILSGRRKVLDDLAHLLSQKEIVQGPELREMLSKSPFKPLTLRPENKGSE